MSGGRDAGRGPAPSGRWVAAAGAFVVSLDSTVNIAFPSMAATFGVPPERMRWVVISYVFTYAVMSFAGGALADRVGHALVFRVGVGLSSVGFLLSGTAPGFGWLLVGRFVQGVAGGLVYGTAPGLVTLAAPPAGRNRALAFLNAAIGVAFTVGPPLAGALIQPFGWRAVFHIRVPLALAALAWSAVGLPSGPGGRGQRGVALGDVIRGPILHASALAFLANAGIFAIWLLAPFYLVGARGLGARVGGVLFMLTPLGTAAGSALAGRITDRVGPRVPVVAGLVCEAAGLAALGRADPTSGLATLGLALLVAGVGLGVFQVPNMAGVIAAFPAGQQGAAGGLTFLSRTLGIVAGVGALSTLFGARRAAAGADAAFRESFLLAAVAVGAAAALAVARFPRRRADSVTLR